MELKRISAKNRRIAKGTLYACIGFIGILLTVGIIFTLLPLNSNVASASSSGDSNAVTTSADGQTLNASGTSECLRMRCYNNTQREKDAARIAAARLSSGMTTSGAKMGIASINPGGTPDYFNISIPNYANSPLPTVDPVTGGITGGIRKFVDSVPGLGPSNANNLQHYIPIAVADNATYSGSDYFEIGLIEYTAKMHSDLNATTLRGYVQVETAANYYASNHIALTYLNGTPITNTTGGQVYAVDNPQYLGPIIIAQRDRPVRVKFTNYLPAGTNGSLFIPVDTTVMGAGEYDINWDPVTKLNLGSNLMGNFSQNRATLHLHGGTTPWISDGTQHQWTTPAGENTSYPKGVSVAYVPDMWFDNTTGAIVASGSVANATNNPGNGSLTFYYTNQQSARLMFYHDHAYGITRLNVYAGEAAAYLLQDTVETTMVNGGNITTATGTNITVAAGTIPADQIPLVIQDKAFLPGLSQLTAEDPTWPIAINSSRSDFWFPHVYMTNQNPYDISGANPVGRWDYGPWFLPAAMTNASGLVHGPVPNPLYGNTPQEGPVNPGIPNPSIVPEAFVDTPIVNGNAYPYVNLGQKAYRFRILNAANDRFFNLQLYYASTAGPFVVFSGGGGSGASATAAVNASGSITSITVTSGGSYTTTPNVSIFDAPGHYTGAGATAAAVIDSTGVVTSVLVTANGTGYSVPIVCSGTAVPNSSLCTEVSMVPAYPGAANFPASWLIKSSSSLPPDIMDNRIGGIPDPAVIGPSMIQIGSEGGFLPAPATIDNRPVGYEKNVKSITVTNIYEHALLMGPAERADVIVDFASVPNGSTLILYNDAPAPVPAFDTRNDYFTDDQDQTSTGGASSTIPGYGPNTRTIMQFRVNGSLGNMSGNSSGFNLTNLTAALPAAYYNAQPAPIVPQADYNTPFNASYPNDAYVRIQDSNVTFLPAAATQPVRSITLGAGGIGYTYANVNITGGGGGTNATAIAGVNVSSGKVENITLTSGGSGYTSNPIVNISGDGTGATANASINLTMELEPKTIQELFEFDYGRMNALLGLEQRNANAQTQTTIPYTDIDPPTELINNSNSAVALGTLGDGTQIWRITHNGVDTHAIHWHMFNVQVINRIGWDGAVKPVDPNEEGWKETVRMNQLEDVIVAVRPIKPDIPFDLPNSIRPLDVTMPLGTNSHEFGASTGWQAVDPMNNPITISNHLVNYGWEYVWHCHLLGHEENIMMRSMIFAVTPNAPFNLTAAMTNSSGVYLTWTDNSTDETAFVIQRSNISNGTYTNIATVTSTTGSGNGSTVNYTDTGVINTSIYFYKVMASNVVGDTTVYAAPAVGFQNITTNSSPSAYAQTNTTTAVNVTYANITPATIVNYKVRSGRAGTNFTTNTTVNVTVTGTVGSVTINLSSIGGSATAPMTNVAGTSNYTITTYATAGINQTNNLLITATGNGGDVNNTVSVPLTVLRLGDVVRDNRVTAVDGMYILREIVGLVTPADPPYTLVGDVDGSGGAVDAADAMYILRYTVGLVPAP